MMRMMCGSEEPLEAVCPTLRGGVLMGVTVVELQRHRLRGVLLAYPIQRQNPAAASTTGHDPDYGRDHGQTDGPHDPRLHP
jgi:hypothetical protein